MAASGILNRPVSHMGLRTQSSKGIGRLLDVRRWNRFGGSAGVCDRVQGLGQFVQHVVFQQVGGCAGVEHGNAESVVAVHRQGNDLHPGKLLLDAPGRLDAVQTRHQDIGDDNVGMQLARESHRLLAVPGFSQQLKVRVSVYKVSHPPAERLAVVCEQYLQGGTRVFDDSVHTSFSHDGDVGVYRAFAEMHFKKSDGRQK